MSAASSNWMQLPALSDSRIGHVAVAAVYDRRFFSSYFSALTRRRYRCADVSFLIDVTPNLSHRGEYVGQ